MAGQRPPPSANAPVLTIFAAPKRFQGHSALIQENAINSWRRLEPRPKLILFTNDDETVEAGRRLGVDEVRRVETNAYGTPLVSNMFTQADALAGGDVMAFVNADIILPQAAVEAARIAREWSSRFLLVAQRWDVDVREPVGFDAGWERGWMREAIARGRLHSEGAIDWFVYPRGQYAQMPPFAIGRTAYDNWLLWSTRDAGIPLIDATGFVDLIHQNHDYSHSKLDTWAGPEALENQRWVRHWTNYYRITHANWTLAADGTIRRAAGWKYRMAAPKLVLSYFVRGVDRRIRTWQFARKQNG